jgi:hypothetical protein
MDLGLVVVCGVQLTSEVGGLMRRMGRHMPPTTAENIMDRLRYVHLHVS